jgi:hypothetical protein
MRKKLFVFLMLVIGVMILLLFNMDRIVSDLHAFASSNPKLYVTLFLLWAGAIWTFQRRNGRKS